MTNTGNVTATFDVRRRLQKKGPVEKEISLPVQQIVIQAQEVGIASWEHRFIDPGEWVLNVDISSPDATILEGETARSTVLTVETCDNLDVYRVWKSGNPTVECKLWGLRMLWWGRIGKLGALVSAFAIVAEFAGPERMRAWGHSLHGVVSVRPLLGSLAPSYLWLFWTLVSWSAKGLLFWLPPTRSLRARFRDNSLRHLSNAGSLGRWLRRSIFGGFIIFGAIAGLLIVLSINDLLFLIVLLILVYMVLVFGWTLILVAPLVFVIVLSAVNGLILEPFAWLMEWGERRIKIASFALFILAFHFDLLAS